MKAIRVDNITFSYDGGNGFALRNVSFDVEQGEIFLIIGESGCGKTTLLRHLKPAYLPEGKRSAESRIEIHGTPMDKMSEREQAFVVGYVGQNVESAQVTDKVWHELAFGLESLGYSQDYMQRRVAEVTAFFGLEAIYHQRLSDISGGQKQLVNLASIMVMEPDILVLDEPTSRLDPLAAADFFRMIRKIHDEIGTTIIMTEHRLEDVMSLASRVMVLDNGRNIMIGTPADVSRKLYERRLPLVKSLPVATRLYYAVLGDNMDMACGNVNEDKDDKGSDYNDMDIPDERVPLTVNEGRTWLQSYMEKKGIYRNGSKNDSVDSNVEYRHESNSKRKDENNSGHEVENESEKIAYKKERTDTVMSANEVWFRYTREGRDVLSDCSIVLPKGTITAVLGGNGAGKSTLLNILYKNITPYLGKVTNKGNSTGFLPQNPQAMFGEKTVRAELKLAQVKSVIEFFNLSELLDSHPFDLSGGQMEKLGLAKLILADHDILLLDEPGKGMDYAFKEKLGIYLKKMAREGKTILLVSHDIEFCASYADRCGLFFDGHIVSMTGTEEFFRNNVFYTTAVRRMCSGLIDAVTVDDVLEYLGKEDELKNIDADSAEGDDGNNRIEKGKNDKEEISCADSMEIEKGDSIIVEGKQDEQETSDVETDCNKATDYNETTSRQVYDNGIEHLLPIIVFLFIMPLTIYLGHTVLHQRKYYFISLALILEGIGTFFVSYEKGKRGLKEIMTIAVMSAITALSRAAFYMIPAVKPMAALTIISGVALGEVDGFLVGALSMLVSDIFFGQGPWTPWQMFTMGLLGFLAGLIFRRENIYKLNRKELILLCTFGLLAVIIVYGGIMNPASVLMYQENVSWKMLLASYVPGIPIDIIHGVSTYIFLWIGAVPMLEKLERVRKK